MNGFTHIEFINKPDTIHIELGAGCGNFGQQYYPDCFLTDKRTEQELALICNCYHVTIFSCDAYKIPCGNNRFHLIIMCNPYGYGFFDKEDASLLLEELYRIIKLNGEIVILTSKTNMYSDPTLVFKRINEYNTMKGKNVFSFYSQTVNISTMYPDYVFYQSDGKNITKPTHKITIKCQQQV